MSVTGVTQQRSRLRNFGALAALLLSAALPGCVKAPSVDFTRPSNGDTGVDASTQIEIAFTQQLDPESATEVANFVVSGSISGPMETTAVLDETGRILTISMIEPFVSGETVTVALTSRITTTVSVALDTFQFSFSIAGVMASPADFEDMEGEFRLIATDPTNGMTGISQRPVIRAAFERPVLTSSLTDTSIRIRGSMSGVREVNATTAMLSGSNQSQVAEQLVAQIAADDEIFEPGETVTVTFTNSLMASPDEEGQPDLSLRPFVASFEAQGGRVDGGFSEALPLDFQFPDEAEAPLRVWIADLTPRVAPEIIFLETSGLIRVLGRQGENSYETIALDAGLSAPVTIAVGDIRNEGRSDLVVLRTDGRIDFLRLAGTAFSAVEEPIQLVAGDPRDLVLADFDGDGFLDIAAGVSEGVEFFRKLPFDQLGATGYAPLEGDPLVVAVRDLAVGDLDQDGRIDLVADTVAGVSVLRNAGNFLFATASTLASTVIEGTLQVADFDGDSTPDIIAAATGGVFVHFGERDLPLPAVWTATTVPLGPGVSPTEIAMGDFDGQVVRTDAGINGRIPDLIWYDADSPTPLGIRFGGSGRTESFAIAGEAPLGGLAVADLNRDQARDILIAGVGVGGEPQAYLSTTIDVAGGGESTFAYRLEGPESALIGGSALPLEVSADLGDNVSTFSVALEFGSEFSISSVQLNPAIFSGENPPIPEVIDSDEGAIIVIDGGGVQFSIGEGIPLFTAFLAIAPTTSPDEYAFAIVPSLEAASGEELASELQLADGGIGIPDLTLAAVMVAVASSVSSVDDLSCGIFDGEPELTWSLPPSQLYDSIRVSRGSALVAVLSGGATSYTDSGAVGSAPYSVVGVLNGVSSLASTCTPPEVFGSLTCVRVTEDLERIRLSWQNPGSYDSVTVLRDGQVAVVLSGNALSYVDDTGDFDGHFYEVFGTDANGEDSTSATCPQGEVGDVNGADATLDPVTSVVLSIEQGVASLSWANGESYDSITIRRNTQEVAQLSGFASSYQEETLPPGSYTYSVRGSGDGIAGMFVNSNTVQAGATSPSGVTCLPSAGGLVVISWENQFDYESIRIERTSAQGEVQILTPDPGASVFVDSAIPDGVYEYTVIGVVGGVDAPSAPCTIEVRNLVRVDDVVTTPGKPGSFRVQAQLLDSISALDLTLSYPADQLEILAVSVPGLAPEDFTVTEAAPVEGSNLASLAVEIPETLGVLFAAGLDRTFLEVDFRTVTSLAAIGSGTISVTSAQLQILGGDDFEPVTDAGQLTVVDNGMFFERAVTTPGGLVEGFIYGSYTTPLLGYEIGLAFDPNVVLVEEISSTGTVADFGGGELAARIEASDGLAGLGGISLGGTPYPAQARAPLAYVRLQVLPTADPTTSLFEFRSWTSTEGIPYSNVFFDVAAGQQEAEPFDGEIVVVSSFEPPVITSIDPATGPFGGGVMVTITGQDFVVGDLDVRFGTEPATEVQLLSNSVLVVTTPGGVTGVVDVTVTTINGSSTLPAAYTYEPFELLGVVPPIADPCVPQAVVVEGNGFHPALEFHFGQGEGTILEIAADGQSAVVLPPPLAEAAPDGEQPVDLTLLDPMSEEVLILPLIFSYVDGFIRGDVNRDGEVDQLDIDYLSAALAGSGPVPVQLDSADINDDGTVHVGDLVLLHAYVHSGGAPPAAPFPELGVDPTVDGLGGGFSGNCE